MTQGLAEEWAPDGIRVNADQPGADRHPDAARGVPDRATAGMLSADEVAGATLRLLRSDLTGQIVDVKRHDLVEAAAETPSAPPATTGA